MIPIEKQKWKEMTKEGITHMNMSISSAQSSLGRFWQTDILEHLVKQWKFERPLGRFAIVWRKWLIFHPRTLKDDKNQKHKHQGLSFQGSGVDGRLCSGIYREISK